MFIYQRVYLRLRENVFKFWANIGFIKKNSGFSIYSGPTRIAKKRLYMHIPARKKAFSSHKKRIHQQYQWVLNLTTTQKKQL